MLKNKKMGTVLRITLSIVIFCIPVFALAQDPGGGPDVPIDGGVSLLLAAGAAYGVKKYRQHKRSKVEEQSL